MAALARAQKDARSSPRLISRLHKYSELEGLFAR